MTALNDQSAAQIIQSFRELKNHDYWEEYDEDNDGPIYRPRKGMVTRDSFDDRSDPGTNYVIS